MIVRSKWFKPYSGNASGFRLSVRKSKYIKRIEKEKEFLQLQVLHGCLKHVSLGAWFNPSTCATLTFRLIVLKY